MTFITTHNNRTVVLFSFLILCLVLPEFAFTQPDNLLGEEQHIERITDKPSGKSGGHSLIDTLKAMNPFAGSEKKDTKEKIEKVILRFDWNTPIEKLKSEAENDDADALIELAERYRTGRNGCPIDDQKRDDLIMRVANFSDKTNPTVINAKGIIYSTGLGVEKNEKTAKNYFKDSASRNYGYALINFGNTCLLEETEKDKGIECLQKAAEQGFAWGQCYLGLCYQLGWGLEQNDTEALKWFKLSAEQGFPPGQVELGKSYCFHRGVPEDHEIAVEWYRKAEKQGDVHAISFLGDHYKRGWGVEKDERKAAEYYRRAADLNYEEAQLQLANCYHLGIGVEKSNDEKEEILNKVVEKHRYKVHNETDALEFVKYQLLLDGYYEDRLAYYKKVDVSKCPEEFKKVFSDMLKVLEDRVTTNKAYDDLLQKYTEGEFTKKQKDDMRLQFDKLIEDNNLINDLLFGATRRLTDIAVKLEVDFNSFDYFVCRKDVADSVVRFCVEENLDYKKLATGVYQLLFDGDGNSTHVVIIVEKDILTFIFSPSQSKIRANRRQEVADYLMRCNEPLRLGRFVLDDDNNYGFKLSMQLDYVDEDKIDERVINQMLRLGLQAVEIYHPGVMSVIFGGKTSKEAYEKVIQDLERKREEDKKGLKTNQNDISDGMFANH
jgi:TPR repeat protein